MKLVDTWVKRGTTLDDLKETIKMVNEKTHFETIDVSEISLTSLLDKNIVKMLRLKEDEDYLFTSSNPGPLEILMSLSQYGRLSADSEKRIKLSNPSVEEKTSELYKEFAASAKSMMTLNGVQYYLSNSFFNAESGSALMAPSVYRDAALVHNFSVGGTAKICYKEVDGVRKAFALLSSRYTPISQEFIFNILPFFEKEMGKIDVKHWEVNHFHTELRIEFPDYAEEISAMYSKAGKYIPGLIISTSDTGDCALRVKGFLRKDNSLFVFREVSRKHLGKFEIEKMTEKIQKSIFEKFTLIPQKMIELMEKDISPADLSTKESQMENVQKVKEYFNILLKETDIVSALGKKGKAQVKDMLFRNINPTTSYNLYDIVDLFMTVPESIVNMSKYSLTKLRQLVALAPFVDFDKKKDIEFSM